MNVLILELLERRRFDPQHTCRRKFELQFWRPLRGQRKHDQRAAWCKDPNEVGFLVFRVKTRQTAAAFGIGRFRSIERDVIACLVAFLFAFKNSLTWQRITNEKYPRIANRLARV